MAILTRATINWTGFQGAPGFTNLFWLTGGSQPDQAAIQSILDRTNTWLTVFQGHLPPAVSTQVDPNVAFIEDTTGNLVAFGSGTSKAAANGGDPSGFSAASGAHVNWGTDGIRKNRRVRGRTFIVPIGSQSYEANGTLTDARRAVWLTASQALAAPGFGTAQLAVWSRPSKGVGTSDGVSFPVTSVQVPDKVAILTSRRD